MFIRSIRQIIQIGLDFLLVFICTFFFLFFSLPPSWLILITLLFSVLKVSFNLFLGSYRELWRYTSFRELQNIGLSTFLASSVTFCCVILLGLPIPNILLFLDAIFSFGLMATLRMIRRLSLNFFSKPVVVSQRFDIPKVLVIGAGRTASVLISDVKSTQAPLDIVGLLDDDTSKVGAKLHGVKIYGTTAMLEAVVGDHKITKIAIAMPSAKQEIINDLVSRARRLNLSVTVAPNIFDLVHQPAKHMYRHSVKIDDMLGIKEIQSDSVAKLKQGRSKRVLVTGGGGYIGAHLIPMLIEDGYQVKVIENFTYGRRGIRAFEGHPQVEIIHGDICDIRAVVNALKDVDYIIALAALVGDPACSLSAKETLNLNYESTKILVETANFYGIKRLIFASSCSVYGASSDAFLTEDSPLNPVSLYAKTRIMSEEVLLDRCGNIEPVILRLSTVFGLSDRMRFDLVVNTLTARGVVDGKFQVFGGNQWRPFIHCKDVAQAFRAALKASSDDVKPTIFNVGSTSMNFTINDVAKLIEAKLPGVQVEYQDVIDDPRNYKVNFDRINEYLNFKTSISIEQGVDEMINALSHDDELRKYSDASYSNVQFLKSVFKTDFE